MKNEFYILIILITFFSCTSRSGSPPAIHRISSNSESKNVVRGKVIAIIDGDTYDLLINGNTTLRVRMEGIDAPEKGMPFYRVSKEYLSGLCFNKFVNLEITGQNGNRELAYAYLDDGKELSQEMLKAGLAWHFKKYNSDPILAQLETEAKNLKKGLWQANNPMPPWVNKSLHKQGISTKDSFVTVDNDNMNP